MRPQSEVGGGGGVVKPSLKLMIIEKNGFGKESNNFIQIEGLIPIKLLQKLKEIRSGLYCKYPHDAVTIYALIKSLWW